MDPREPTELTSDPRTGGRVATDPVVVFSGVARLELDQLLEQLVERAQDVMQTQGRLRGLLAATQAIATTLEPQALLRHIVEAACTLVGARYGALGVIDKAGHELREFITVGMDATTEARIGPRPKGRGVLGLLLATPQAVRFADIAKHPDSVGFPQHHPPLRSFLGVPIAMRDRVFGNLYLAEKVGGSEFSADDQELLTALASAAAVSIENAQLMATAARRQRWLSASTEVSHALLREGGDALPLVAALVHDAGDVDLAVITRRTADGDRFEVVAAAGAGADDLTGETHDLAGSATGRALRDDVDLLLDEDLSDEDPSTEDLNDKDPSTEDLNDEDRAAARGPFPTGPALVVRLRHGDAAPGTLVLRRHAGRPAFTDAELAMAVDFAAQAALALQASHALRERHELQRLADREQIAQAVQRDVINDLFTVGMGLEGLNGRKPELAEQLEPLVSMLDGCITALRRSIYAVRSDDRDTAT